MKGLLQSKKFRKNLGKWLCMYAGVMLLLTTVVTYSRYMTNLQGSGKASTAKFQLKINCTSSNGKECGSDTEPYNVTDDDFSLAYTFTVDTKDVDVKSKLKLLTFVHNSFIIEDISTSFNTNFKLCEDSETSKCPTKINSKLYYLDEITLPDTDTDFTFTVTVKYNDAIKDLPNDKDKAKSFDEVVAIGYSIEQIAQS